MTNPDRWNHYQISPPVDVPSNTYTHNVYQRIEARPAPRREGTRQAEEGLVLDGAISGGFVGGVRVDQDDHAVFEIQVARGRGRLGAGHPVRPPYGAGNQLVTDPEVLGQFGQAMDYGDNPGLGGHFNMPVREGAGPNLAPRGGLARGERENQIIVAKMGFNPRRRNRAEIGRREA